MTSSRHQQRAKRQAADVQRARRRRLSVWAGGILAVASVATLIIFATTQRARTPSSESASQASRPTVGGDLHTLNFAGDGLYVGGHAAAAVSRDNGRTWTQITSLEGADAMGWATPQNTVLVGGHTGLYRSTDNGATFRPATGAAAVSDVHALGGSGKDLYLASPRAGLLVSSDAGASWRLRNSEVGRAFMGTLLVDPTDSDRVLATDMSAGLTISTNGGLSWKSLGAPLGAMSSAWNPSDRKHIVAVTMSGGLRSLDAGTTWQSLNLPPGSSVITYSPDGGALFAGVLNAPQAIIYRSTDDGATWNPGATVAMGER
jgi:photosystem II stability/assembly factor-like uncharacterized protein